MASRVPHTYAPLFMTLPPHLQHLEELYKKMWVSLVNYDRRAFQQLANNLPLSQARDSARNTTLHFSAAVGDPEAICYVLNRPSNAPPVNATNSNGHTALQSALMNMRGSEPNPKYREVVRLLLEAGADPRQPKPLDNGLSLASQVKCPDTIYMLYSSLIDREPINKRLVMLLRNTQWSLKHFIWTGDLELMKMLVEYDRSILHSSDFRMEPLHQAVEARAPVEFFRLFLQECKLNPNDANPQTMNTPLHEVCELAGEWDNAADVVRTLLEWGACPNHTNRKGMNCLHLAAKAGSDPVVKILLEYKVHTDLWDLTGKNPMIYAAMSGSVQVIETLHNAGLSGSVRCRTEDGASTLHLASRFCHPEAVALLITKMGLDPNERDLQNKTPLHYAVESQASNLDRRCAETVDILVDFGADLFDESNENISPLRYCLERNFLHNACIIIRYLALSKPSDKSLNDFYMNTINENEILKEVYDSCLAEVKSMKKFVVDGWVTLYEIVTRPSKSIRPLMRNVAFKKKMNALIIDHVLSKTFPVYSSRIIERFTYFEKEQKRINFARESLSCLTGFGDPQGEIIGKIFRHLNSEDVDSLYQHKLKEDKKSFLNYRKEMEEKALMA